MLVERREREEEVVRKRQLLIPVFEISLLDGRPIRLVAFHDECVVDLHLVRLGASALKKFQGGGGFLRGAERLAHAVRHVDGDLLHQVARGREAIFRDVLRTEPLVGGFRYDRANRIHGVEFDEIFPGGIVEIHRGFSGCGAGCWVFSRATSRWRRPTCSSRSFTVDSNCSRSSRSSRTFAAFSTRRFSRSSSEMRRSLASVGWVLDLRVANSRSRASSGIPALTAYSRYSRSASSISKISW